MGRITGFLKTSLLGGVVVILPVAIMASVFIWLFNLVNTLIHPLTSWLTNKTYFDEYIADAIVIIFLIATCFFVGLLVTGLLSPDCLNWHRATRWSRKRYYRYSAAKKVHRSQPWRWHRFTEMKP